MVNFWVRRVKAGLTKLEDINPIWGGAVEKALKEEGWNG